MTVYIITYATEFEILLTEETKIFKTKTKAEEYLNSINEYGEFEIFEYELEDEQSSFYLYQNEHMFAHSRPGH